MNEVILSLQTQLAALETRRDRAYEEMRRYENLWTNLDNARTKLAESIRFLTSSQEYDT